MSELIQHNDNRATIRWKLLTGASALALTAYISSTALANAEDSDRPTVWIELGGQLSRLQDGQETYMAPFETGRPSIFSPSEKFEKPPLYSIDEFASLSFQPEDSSWIFAASVHYGRSTSNRHVRQQTYPTYFHKYFPGTGRTPVPSTYAQPFPIAAKFADTKARTSERFDILDFSAGKDVGLGMFGRNGSSTVNLGVRFAQFQSKSNIAIKSDPDWHFITQYFGFIVATATYGQAFHSNAASMTAQRSFRGVGPSISWKNSTPIAGNTQDGAITLDWGLNAAMLFGRQKAKIHHQSTAQYHKSAGYIFGSSAHSTHHYAFPDQDRSRSVTVPNVGGFAGLSYQYADAKLSFGYRADFFFNAIDGGIDARKDENRAFYGPYASISIGLGN